MSSAISHYRDRVSRLAADPSIRPHGDLGTYNNWGCRCPECRAIRLEYDRARVEEQRREDFAVLSAEPEHGLAGYRQGCKCQVCLAAGKLWADTFSVI